MRRIPKEREFEYYFAHFLNISDKILTFWGLQLGFQELNPIVKLFIFNVGSILGIILAGIMGFYSIHNLFRKKHYKLFRFVWIIYFIVCISNLSKIIAYYKVLFQ